MKQIAIDVGLGFIRLLTIIVSAGLGAIAGLTLYLIGLRIALGPDAGESLWAAGPGDNLMAGLMFLSATFCASWAAGTDWGDSEKADRLVMLIDRATRLVQSIDRSADYIALILDRMSSKEKEDE